LRGKSKAKRSVGRPEIEYLTASYKLARRLMRLWGEQRLRACVGLIYNFIRAPKRKAWSDLPTFWRDHAENLALSFKGHRRRIAAGEIVIFGLQSVREFISDGKR